MTSDSFNKLLDGNRRFAEQFEAGDLTIRPSMSTIILTCVDARVDPAHLFGLGLGDAVVIRNTGGRITRAVTGDLGILSVLGANMPGSGAMQPELVVIHHTDCGMSRLAIPAIQQQVAERLGLSMDEVAAMAITDPAMSVQSDIERLRSTPGIPDQLVVSGLVYDVSSATINQIVPPAPLRATACQGRIPDGTSHITSSEGVVTRSCEVPVLNPTLFVKKECHGRVGRRYLRGNVSW